MSDTVVRAVAVATIGTQNREMSARIQFAMSNAVLICNAAGISTEEINTPVIRACMQAAREAVKASWPDVADTVAPVMAILASVKGAQ